MILAMRLTAVILFSTLLAARLLIAAPVPSAVVNPESLMVYAQTSERSQIVGSLARGARVTIDMTLRGSDGEWCQVTTVAASAPLGFVRCAALDLVPSVSDGTAPAPVRLPAPADSTPNRSLRGTGELHLLPLGPLPSVSLPHLVSYYRAKLALDIAVLPSMDLDTSSVDRRRGQLVAERVHDLIQRKYSNLLRRRRAVVIGIMEHDMYILGIPDWKFAFAARGERIAIVSAARMNPQYFGDPPDTDLLHTRLRKIVTKNIGVLYLGMRESANPASVMFKVLGVDELDRIGEDF